MDHNLEREILMRLQQGSSDAFEFLFHKYGGKLYNFMLSISSQNIHQSEEIVQRTFVKVWETHSAVNPDKSFISYLCTIAKNMLVNEYEHLAVRYVYNDYILKTQSEADYITDNEVDKNLLEEYVDILIDKLPPARKQVFILSRKEMLTNKEIAERLSISEKTVQNQLAKSMAFMKEHLARYYEYIFVIAFYNYFVN